MHKTKLAILFAVSSCVVLCTYAFKEPSSIENGLFPKLSSYKIYKGSPTNLHPTADYFLYELASPLFTDYSEKQRLVKLPLGKKMSAINDGLIELPEGTIIVKTFYYYHDKRDTSHGKQLVETRVLQKKNNIWLTGTYEWNLEQTEAFLTDKSPDKTISWTNQIGQVQNIEYHIPSTKDCKTCHQQDHRIEPIGLKAQNLNFKVLRDNTVQNQLTFLAKKGHLALQNASFVQIVNYQDTTAQLSKRTRAYLDINCAHCHNPKGSAASKKLDFNYRTPLENTKILSAKQDIIKQIEKQKMPKIGTTVIDKEGLVLIKAYLGTLN